MQDYKIEAYFPSTDGNPIQRKQLLRCMEELLQTIDQRKSQNSAVLSGELEQDYSHIFRGAEVPKQGISWQELLQGLDTLIQGNPNFNHRNYLNAIPTPAIPSLMGMLTTMILNNNTLWDVFAPSAAKAEIMVTAMMGKVIGYPSEKVGGYFTYGGNAGLINSMRIGVEKACPGSRTHGIPQNLYAFASDKAHFSVMKAAEMGIGTDHVILIKTLDDGSMDPEALALRMEEVLQRGGAIALVVATTGTTDTFAIDDIRAIKEVIDNLVTRYHLPYTPHLHADGAMGGLYAFFNHYDFAANPLQLSDLCISELLRIVARLSGVNKADSISLDFHKLGQCPYNTSLYLLRDASDFQRVGLDMEHCPYIGEQNYGGYFTSYTLESSRMGSAMAAYANLMAFGVEGFQQILAHLVDLSARLRLELRNVPGLMPVSTNPGPITLIRAYKSERDWFIENEGEATVAEIEANNDFNSLFIQQLRVNRQSFMFGDTSHYKEIVAADTKQKYPLNASKVFLISPLTRMEDLSEAVQYLRKQYHMIKYRSVQTELRSAVGAGSK